MDLKTSLNNIKLDLTELVIIPSGGSTGFDLNFDITAKEFLSFAKDDLHLNNLKGIVNGMTNAKRSIDCKIDEIISRIGVDYMNLPKSLEKFVSCFDFDDDIPYKLKIVQALNLAPGFIISKYRILRNKLEHLYIAPSIDEVKEAVDIAELFIRSIDGHFKSETNEFYITDEKKIIKDYDFEVGLEFDYEDGSNMLGLWERIADKRVNKIDISSDQPEFFGLLRLMNSIDDEFELTQSFKIILQLINHPIPQKHIKVRQK